MLVGCSVSVGVAVGALLEAGWQAASPAVSSSATALMIPLCVAMISLPVIGTEVLLRTFNTSSRQEGFMPQRYQLCAANFVTFV
jgi:hypothetical protein